MDTLNYRSKWYDRAKYGISKIQYDSESPINSVYESVDSLIKLESLQLQVNPRTGGGLSQPRTGGGGVDFSPPWDL